MKRGSIWLACGVFALGMTVMVWCLQDRPSARAAARSPAIPLRKVTLPDSAAPTLRLEAVDNQLRYLEARTGSTLGVYAWHIESGNRYAWRPQESFAQASVYKLAIATHVLQRVQTKQLALDSLVTVTTVDYCPGSGILQYSLGSGTALVRIERLLYLMLAESDNTATDVLLRLSGGPYNVQESIYSWGIAGLRVDRTVAGMFAGCTARPLPLAHERSIAGMNNRYLYGFTPAEMGQAAQRMQTDSLDTATPQALARLLHLLHTGKLLDDPHKARLYEWLARCNTGYARIPLAMPRGAVIHHKTGTFFGTCNDVAIVRLPDNRGHLLLVILMKGPAHNKAILERTLAEAAAAVYAHLPLHAPGEKFGG
ncbi:MAG: serine hydrolase [Bacteroidetes bacterium]|nr:serine hydrolase [Bacteroidota bacterium]